MIFPSSFLTVAAMNTPPWSDMSGLSAEFRKQMVSADAFHDLDTVYIFGSLFDRNKVCHITEGFAKSKGYPFALMPVQRNPGYDHSDSRFGFQGTYSYKPESNIKGFGETVLKLGLDGSVVVRSDHITVGVGKWTRCKGTINLYFTEFQSWPLWTLKVVRSGGSPILTNRSGSWVLEK
jgi:hypothetical protein